MEVIITVFLFWIFIYILVYKQFPIKKINTEELKDSKSQEFQDTSYFFFEDMRRRSEEKDDFYDNW